MPASHSSQQRAGWESKWPGMEPVYLQSLRFLGEMGCVEVEVDVLIVGKI